MALIQHVDPPLDARQRLDAFALEADQHAGGVLVRAASHLRCFSGGGVDDLRRALLRGPNQLTVLEQQRGLLLRATDDRPALLGGALGDAAGLLGDPPRLADLLGDRRAKLIDELEDGGLVEDDVVRQRQLLAGGDQ